MVKLETSTFESRFLFQPLPVGRVNAGFYVSDTEGRSLPNALVQFYDRGDLVARLKTNPSGNANACLHPISEVCDVRITAGEMGTWLFDVALPPGERWRRDVPLPNAVSISGRVLAMDGSPQNAMVVQAIHISAPSFDPGGAAQHRGPNEDRTITPLLPLPAFSETVLSDDEGNFKFVNLRPGNYRLRCHGPDGYISPESDPESAAGATGVIAVQPDRAQNEIIFKFPEAKKGVWQQVPITIGLDRVEPRSLHRTPDGRLWIGTTAGSVHVYDGTGFEVFTSPDVPGGDVYVIERATDGSEWIGTRNGVARYADGDFQTLSINDRLARKPVLGIASESDGSIWIGTHSGLLRYDGQNYDSFTATNGLPSNFINCLLKARDGTLWLGTGSGLVSYDGRSFQKIDLFPSLIDPGIGTTIFQSKEGPIWFSSADLVFNGALRYDGKSFSQLTSESGLLSDHIWDTAETSDGDLWFATPAGLSRFNGSTVINYTEKDGLVGGSVSNIFADSDDVLWCTGLRSVFRFDPKGFKGFTSRDGLQKRGGVTPEILDSEPSQDGGFWIGTGWGGLYRTDGKTFQHVEDSVSEDSYVRDIHQDADGQLWLATRSGIIKHEGSRSVRVFDGDWIAAVTKDLEGNLWYGQGWAGGGLSRYNPETGESEFFTTAHGLPNNEVWALATSADGGVWVGTGGGLARYRNGKIEDFRDSLGISTGGIFDLRIDADETLWIGSGQGLHQWDGFERLSITAADGLPGQHIWRSARTPDGIIWMGSDSHGLLGYDGKAVTELDMRDGLLGNSVLALAPNSDGSLCIGFSGGGFTQYRPTTTRPSVRFLKVQLSDQTLTEFSDLPGIETGDRVTIQYQEIDLKTHPDKRQFRYRVEDPSGETLYASVTKDRRFEWTPLKGGPYTFEIQAIDRDLNYSEPARLTFRATVPWYANAWITVPGGGAFAGLLVWAFIARALYLAKRREAARLHERARIARNLHDHMGASLTHLALLGNSVRQQSEEPAITRTLAHQLSESAQELSRTMSEVTWATDPTKDTLESFVSYVSTYSQKFLAPCDLRLRLDFPQEIPDVSLRAELRHNLFLVVKESLNNVAKHARASEVRIELKLSEHTLHLSIQDDGCGFLRTEVRAESHGLDNMRKRLADLGGGLSVDGEGGQGTRVQARVPLPKK